MNFVWREAALETRHTGQRFDQVAAELFSEFSRSQLQQWIRQGAVRLDGRVISKPNHRLAGTGLLQLEVTLQAHNDDQPEAIALQVLYADEHLLMVNKPAGLVVHPGAGNPAGTLVNALLHLHPDLATLPRAGIVHRLDKLTSGILLVARHAGIRLRLIELMQSRAIQRSYLALVWGQPPAAGEIAAPIGRHPVDRKRMAIHDSGSANARPAVTRYVLQQAYRDVSLLDIELQTGRTHQIRVHMQHLGFPLVGDPVYGRQRHKQGRKSALSKELYQLLQDFPRQALHARRLRLQHPVTQAQLDVCAPAPDDLTALLAQLDADDHNSD